MDLQPDVNKLNRKLLQIIGKEMNELDDKIRLLKKENDLLKNHNLNLIYKLFHYFIPVIL